MSDSSRRIRAGGTALSLSDLSLQLVGHDELPANKAAEPPEAEPRIRLLFWLYKVFRQYKHAQQVDSALNPGRRCTTASHDGRLSATTASKRKCIDKTVIDTETDVMLKATL
jgi:hypothetical protein